MDLTTTNSTLVPLIGAIQIEIKSVYGKLLAYPVDTNARIFCSLVGSKTLTNLQLRKIEALGFEIISMANADWSRVE